MRGGHTIDPDTRVQRKPDPIFSRLDDDLIALDTKTGLAHSLNASGARVWELLETPTSVGDLCERVAHEYDVDPGTCTAQVSALLDDLSKAGLVEVG